METDIKGFSEYIESAILDLCGSGAPHERLKNASLRFMMFHEQQTPQELRDEFVSICKELTGLENGLDDDSLGDVSAKILNLYAKSLILYGKNFAVSFESLE